jgi:uncharacterized protein involved in exopolysaccharide biosynthesis
MGIEGNELAETPDVDLHSDQTNPRKAAGEDLISLLDGVGSGFGLTDALSLASRRRYIILFITAIGTFLAGSYAYTRDPVYTAETQMIIESEDRVINLESVVSGLPSDTAAIETEINLLTSRGMLTQLAEHLQAAGMGPDEDEDEPKPSGLDALISNIAIASGLHPVVEEKAEPSAESLFDWWVDELERNMDVHQMGNSFVIVLNYTSTDPSVAATVANTLAEVYIEGQINRRRAATGKATQFLKQRVGELEEELRVAEEAVHT